MNKTSIAVLQRTLKSPGRGAVKPLGSGTEDAGDSTPTVLVLTNNLLPVPLYVYQMTEAGQQVQVYNDDSDPVMLPASPPGQDNKLGINVAPGFFYVLRTVYSGSFVGVFQANDDGTTVKVDPTTISGPNDIGAFPKPTMASPIPLDSPLVLVGCASLPNSNILCREQYWARGADSYVLAPGTKRVVATTTTSGIQSTSSRQEDVSTALGFSASAGWGPISASISGSLSSNASTFQQMMISSEITQYESLELHNKTESTQMYLKWQLVNVVTILAPVSTSGATARGEADSPITPPTPPSSAGGQGPIAMLVTAESPILIDGPYDPLHLPPGPS